MNPQLKIAIGAIIVAIVMLITDRFAFNDQVGDTTIVQQTIMTPLAMFLLAVGAVAAFFGFVTRNEKKKHRKVRR